MSKLTGSIRIWLPVSLIVAALALGFLVSQSWFILAFVVLMMSMHLFGHGHHGGGHSHGDAEEDTSEEKSNHEHLLSTISRKALNDPARVDLASSRWFPYGR